MTDKTAGKDTNKNIALDCEIVADLLPLYHDKVVSAVTEKAVKEHLEGCENCSAQYETLCAELPHENEEKPHAKERFSAMMKRIKHKGLIKGIVIAAAAVAALGGVWYLLTEVPLVEVPAEDIEVVRTYRYDLGDKVGEQGFFIYFKEPVKYFSGPQHGDYSVADDGTLEISLKSPIITYTRSDDDPNEKYEDIWTICEEHDIDTVSFNGKKIWSAEENGSDELPGYVEAYHDFEWSYDENITWSTDNDTFTAYYEDGTMKTWDLNGNVIYEGKITEEE